MAVRANPAVFILILIALFLGACGGSSSSSDETESSENGDPPEQQPEAPDELASLEPDTTPDPVLPAPGSANYEDARRAARFLTQATFGPTAKSIVDTMGTSREQWIDEQIALPQTRHLSLLDERLEEVGFEPAPEEEDDSEGWVRDLQRSDIWWESAIWGEDQLRQKVAYALSQILVISNVSDVLFNDSRGIAHYHDILAEHAFGNYRELLEAVTLNPMMGEYLSMIRNEKANAERNIRPDENYAREVMQLFSIGLVELNLDGTPKLDGQGDPIPTYGQDDIKNLARVFTGWNHGTIDNWWEWVNSGDSEIVPMKPFNNYHDTGRKVLFGDQVIPAGQTPREDIESALDILFGHDNVGPFISKQLIQRLVTSNPSPDYVARVAGVFNDNGSGAKGDMEAVIKAILTDEEAINGHIDNPETFGKLREPILKVSAVWRAFKAQGVPVEEEDGSISQNRLRFRGTDREFGQRPYGSFSVFNFYRPDYQHPGEIKDADLLSPEFQIMTDSQIISAISYLGFNIYWRDTQNDWPQSETVGAGWDIYPTQLYLEEEKAIAAGGDAAALLDRVNLLLMAGQMSESMYEAIHQFLTETTPTASPAPQVYDAIFLTVASPEFAVQR